MSERHLCIGCACDEDHACMVPLTAAAHLQQGCAWLRFDAGDRAGVCSGCEDLVRQWDAGFRVPLFEQIALRFYRQALGVYEPQDAMRWMRTAHPLLGGNTPREMILAGRIEEVRTLLEQIRSGAFA